MNDKADLATVESLQKELSEYKDAIATLAARVDVSAAVPYRELFARLEMNYFALRKMLNNRTDFPKDWNPHLIVGPNGLCMCGTKGLTCAEIVAQHASSSRLPVNSICAPIPEHKLVNLLESTWASASQGRVRVTWDKSRDEYILQFIDHEFNPIGDAYAFSTCTLRSIKSYLDSHDFVLLD